MTADAQIFDRTRDKSIIVIIVETAKLQHI